jgi:hypothetical protein
VRRGEEVDCADAAGEAASILSEIGSVTAAGTRARETRARDSISSSLPPFTPLAPVFPPFFCSGFPPRRSFKSRDFAKKYDLTPVAALTYLAEWDENVAEYAKALQAQQA